MPVATAKILKSLPLATATISSEIDEGEFKSIGTNEVCAGNARLDEYIELEKIALST